MTEQIIHAVLGLVMTLAAAIFASWSRELRGRETSVRREIETLRLDKDKDIQGLKDDMTALTLQVESGSRRCSEKMGDVQKGIGLMTERLARIEARADWHERGRR